MTGAEDEGKSLRKWQSGAGERVGGQHRAQDPSLPLFPGQSDALKLLKTITLGSQEQGGEKGFPP